MKMMIDLSHERGVLISQDKILSDPVQQAEGAVGLLHLSTILTPDCR